MAEVPQDFFDDYARLKNRVAQLEGRANIRPAMDQVIDGKVTIGGGGLFEVRDSDGSSLLFTGRITPDYQDGSPQRGTIMWRADGTVALAVYASGTDPAKRQELVAWDSAGQTVFSTTGDGLGRPYLAVPMWPAATPQWPTITGTGWQDLWTGTMPRQHAAVDVMVLGICAGSGATGQLRLMVNGTQVGSPSTHDTASYSWGMWAGPIPSPGPLVTSDVVLTVQGRMTSSSGSIMCRLDHAYTRE